MTTVIPTARPFAALSSFLDAGTADLVAVVAAGVAVVALAVAVAALVRLSRMRRAYTLLQGDDGQASFIEAVDRKAREVEGLRAQVEALTGDVGRVRDDLAEAVRHVAVVRYDAFAEMGGRMSFSAALLDDAGDGAGDLLDRGPVRHPHLRQGREGRAQRPMLSPEEQQAVDYALRGPPAPAVLRRVGGGRDRVRAEATGYAYFGPEGTFTETAAAPARPTSVTGRCRRTPPSGRRWTRCAAGRPAPRWCRWRTRSRAACRRPWTSWPAASR